MSGVANCAAVMLAGCLSIVALAQSPDASPAPSSWWRQYTPVVSLNGDLKECDGSAAGAIRNVGYPAGWYGYWFRDDQRRIGVGARSWKWAAENHMRRIIYYDSGEVGDYAGFFDAHGKIAYNGWSLPWWKGEPVTARWFGLSAFMADAPWAPFPTAKHYGLPTFIYPDGKPAAEIYDVLARRQLNGEWKYDYASNPRVTDDIAQRSGLASLSGRQAAKADVVGKTGWQTVRLVDVDFACPQLREFRCKELAREITEQRPDGVHIDNHGDTNTVYPQIQAFGLWNLHAFRQWLQRHVAPAQLAAWGVTDVAKFDIRDHLRQKPLDPPGQPSWRWVRPDWTRDPLWNCFVLSTAESALEFHRAVYRAGKEAARQAGIDCLICGNLVPGFPGHELLNGACDIVHFEWKTSGRLGPYRGSGLPPLGRAGYIVRLAAAVSTAGYCWPSIYVTKEYAGQGHENLHKTLAFDCLASNGLLDFGHAYLDGYSPGTAKSAGFVNRFIRANAQRTSGRRHIAEVALIYSPWTALASVTVARALTELWFDEYAGWATFLDHQRRQWDVVLSDQLSVQRLQGIPVVVLPSVAVLDDRQLDVLREYVRGGGRVVATGPTATREGAEHFLRLRDANGLRCLADIDRVRICATEPGRLYWTEDQSAAAGEQMRKLLEFPNLAPRLCTNAPGSVSLTLTQGAREPFWMLDLVNHHLDPFSDQLTPAPACQVTLTLPPHLAGRPLKIEYVLPGGPTANTPQTLSLPPGAAHSTALTLHLPSFPHAMLVVVSAEAAAARHP